MSDNRVASAGMGFTGWLTLVFVVLKLVGQHFHTPIAQWSWWLVFVPLWGPLAFIVAIAIIVGIGFLLVTGIAATIDFVSSRRRARKVKYNV